MPCDSNKKIKEKNWKLVLEREWKTTASPQKIKLMI